MIKAMLLPGRVTLTSVWVIFALVSSVPRDGSALEIARSNHAAAPPTVVGDIGEDVEWPGV